MLLIPAIDIRNGNCVRLLQGDPDKETVYSSNPVDMARDFEEMGARLIHVVDLDGAFTGDTVNFDLIARIAASVKIPIEVGGGIRTTDAVQRYLDAGIGRIILGTVVLRPQFSGIIEKFRKNIIAGIDARNSMVATHGWKNISEINALEFIKELKNIGIREIIYTDISTDGMLSGPNFSSIEKILTDIGGIDLIASGGISSYADILKLKEFTGMGLKGCILGKAIYDRRIDLREAIRRVN